MKELGGYFGLEQLISNEYYKDLVSLNSGRNALVYILKARNIKKLYIPYYLCDSIDNMLKTYGYSFQYYNVDSSFNPIFHKKLADDEYIYIVNYYGQLTNDRIVEFKQKFNRIIIDNTQAFFQKPIKNIDTIYSCRKFFGVPDGAYLHTNVNFKYDLDIDTSKDRMIHILGRYEGMVSEYYSHFKNNEKLIGKVGLKYMSKLTHNILGAIDYEKVRQIRNKNYIYLKNNLYHKNKLKLKTIDGAFVYPFYTENGNEVRGKLIQKKIYIPILWPNVLNNVSEDSIEYNYVVNILPIPCDQRYSIEDMRYIINILSTF